MFFGVGPLLSVNRVRSHNAQYPVMQWAGLFLLKPCAFTAGQAEILTRLAGLNGSDSSHADCYFLLAQVGFFTGRQHFPQQRKLGLQRIVFSFNIRVEKHFEFQLFMLNQFQDIYLNVSVVDTKWKRIDEPTNDIDQNDMYQLYSYGKKYNCEKVALIYPQTDKLQNHVVIILTRI